MSDLNKKYLIAALLLGACLISIYLLFTVGGEPIKRLTSIAEADSLIRRDLRTFNISERNLSRHTFLLNDSTKRFEYEVRVPGGFSKTHFHQEIHDTFFEYGATSPARVIFPEKNYHIYLLLNNTVFATLKVVTDEDLVMARSFGSVLIAFEDPPSSDELRRLENMDPALRVVLKIEEPEEVTEYLDNANTANSHFAFWLEQNGDIGQDSYTESLLPKIMQLQEAAPQAELLNFQNLEQKNNATFVKMFSGTSMNYIDVSEAIVLHDDLGKTAFQREFQRFILHAQRGQSPIAIVMASEETLRWLPQELSEFKKSGLTIVPPKKETFKQ